MTELFLFPQFLVQHSAQSRCSVQFVELICYNPLSISVIRSEERREAISLVSSSSQA